MVKFNSHHLRGFLTIPGASKPAKRASSFPSSVKVLDFTCTWIKVFLERSIWAEGLVEQLGDWSAFMRLRQELEQMNSHYLESQSSSCHSFPNFPHWKLSENDFLNKSKIKTLAWLLPQSCSNALSLLWRWKRSQKVHLLISAKILFSWFDGHWMKFLWPAQ